MSSGPWMERVERPTPCPGVGMRGQFTRGQVGFCPVCGVRTFTSNGLIKPHASVPREIELQRRRPRRPL